ncbi:MAG: hypothetical protein V3574_04775 [Candidatus Moraniibacteriota bacterium]
MLKNAFRLYNEIEKKTKRKTYLRSAYFKKEKVFFDYFKKHIFQKSPRERMKRLKYFKAAIELIKYSKNKPIIKENGKEVFYRFAGMTKERELFYVQIKENKKGEKYFMSCFPPG